MSACLNDMNLIIISAGETQYWRGCKGCGGVILESGFGLYAKNSQPDLSWLPGSYWEGLLKLAKKPLKQPEYGDLIVNFDEKLIMDNTGYGSPFDFNAKWLMLTWKHPARAVLTEQSLRNHLGRQRIRAIGLDDLRLNRKGVLLSGSYDKAGEQLQQLMQNENTYARAFRVFFDTPHGWRIESTS